MNKDIDKIKKMFASLSAEEQNTVLFDLNKSKQTINTDTMDISIFATKHQKEYGKDITFTVNKLDDNNLIQVTLHTVFGNFTGAGTNQKIAKVNAVKSANDTWND